MLCRPFQRGLFLRGLFLHEAVASGRPAQRVKRAKGNYLGGPARPDASRNSWRGQVLAADWPALVHVPYRSPCIGGGVPTQPFPWLGDIGKRSNGVRASTLARLQMAPVPVPRFHAPIPVPEVHRTPHDLCYVNAVNVNREAVSILGESTARLSGDHCVSSFGRDGRYPQTSSVVVPHVGEYS